MSFILLFSLLNMSRNYNFFVYLMSSILPLSYSILACISSLIYLIKNFNNKNVLFFKNKKRLVVHVTAKKRAFYTVLYVFLLIFSTITIYTLSKHILFIPSFDFFEVVPVFYSLILSLYFSYKSLVYLYCATMRWFVYIHNICSLNYNIPTIYNETYKNSFTYPFVIFHISPLCWQRHPREESLRGYTFVTRGSIRKIIIIERGKNINIIMKIISRSFDIFKIVVIFALMILTIILKRWKMSWNLFINFCSWFVNYLNILHWFFWC